MPFFDEPGPRPRTPRRTGANTPAHWGIDKLEELKGIKTSGFLEGLLVVLAGIGIAAVALLGIALVVLIVNAFFGFFVWLAWNIAIVPIVASAGGTLGSISYIQAIGVAFVINVLRRIFGGSKESS